MSRKKGTESPEEKNNYVATVRNGAVAANIFVGQSLDGFDYHYFKLSRAYKARNAKDFKYTDRFFSRNAEAIAGVVTQAATRCEELDAELENGLVTLEQSTL